MRKIPVIESTPFWIPGGPGHADMVGLEIQPSAHAIMPYAPKSRRGKVVSGEYPNLSFFTHVIGGM